MRGKLVLKVIALALAITHPRSGEQMEFIAPPPTDFVEYLAQKSLTADAPEIQRWIETR